MRDAVAQSGLAREQIAGIRDAVKTALLSMISDGKYTEILKKWGVEDSGLTADQVNSGKL